MIRRSTLTCGSLLGAHTGSLLGLLLGISSSGLLDQVLTVGLGISGLLTKGKWGKRIEVGSARDRFDKSRGKAELAANS